MRNYILRRLLLMVPTLLGISIVCFALIQAVPGGPVEQMIARVRAASAEHGANSSRTISPEEVNNIKAYFGFDKPAHVRYFLWLGNVLELISELRIPTKNRCGRSFRVNFQFPFFSASRRFFFRISFAFLWEC